MIPDICVDTHTYSTSVYITILCTKHVMIVEYYTLCMHMHSLQLEFMIIEQYATPDYYLVCNNFCKEMLALVDKFD